jgi:type I restriction enzyme S subunit
MNAKVFCRICFPLPSLPLQRCIASILSAYDNLIEANSRRIKILEQMAENLYKEWFVRFRFPNYQNTPIENGIPKGWKVERLKNITKRLPFNRLYKAADLEPIGNVIVIDQSTNAYLGYHNNAPSHYANIDNPIIIFGDHSCKFQLMIQNFSLGENVVPFISNDSGILDCYYFYFATHKLIETEEYKRHWGRLMAMKILLPSIESQKAFAKIIKPIFSQIITLQLQSANLTRQRDLLLPRLMSGQLTPLTNQ